MSILIRTSVPDGLGKGNEIPAVLLNQGVGLNEAVDGNVSQLVLENDNTRMFRV